MNLRTKPLVSVVMSVHNGEPFLEEAIVSILNQTFNDFEFIVIDDASTDRSLEIIEDYAKNDKRIKAIKNDKNIGLTKSLTKAISITKCRYIARQDSDDISLPQRLEKQVEFLDRNPFYGAVGTSAEIIDENGVLMKKAIIPKSWLVIRQVLRFGNCFLHGSMMFRKYDYIKAGGYREFMSLGQDFDLWLRISKIKKMKNLKENLYQWRKTCNNISSIKRDMQIKIGTLALFDYRYGKNLSLKEDFKINDLIDGMDNEDRRKYYTCLRDLCLCHGNIKVAEKYCKDKSIFNKVIINFAGIIFKLIRLIRT